MDQINFERSGIPTVTIATGPFTTLAKTVALSEAGVEICSVVVKHPMGMIPPAEIRQKAEDAFSEILKAATQWQPVSKLVPPGKKAQPDYPAAAFDFTGTVEDVNKLFFDKGWSLGLPVIPPTPGRVAGLLKGTSRQPDEVLGQVPPRMGSLTVELVAVHAAMAGCKPEYMPVLIAALEGFLSPDSNWRGGLATTGTTQMVVIVNGPVIKEIGLACDQGAAGKGYHPNATIGYALNLIAFAVGGSRPPMLDKSTLGSPADYVCWVFGENESQLPAGWLPLHVQKGFKTSDSVVTVMVSYPPLDNIDHWSSTPEEHVRFWGYTISPLHDIGGPCRPLVLEQNPVVGLSPEHALLIASSGWSKQDFLKALWEQARIPLSAWPSACSDTTRLKELLGNLTPGTKIPIVSRPENFLVVIAGGAGKHSHYFPPFPGSMPISTPVGK